MTPPDFEKDYKAGFDYLTNFIKLIPSMKGWEMRELVMPDGEVQRWFLGDKENLVISYKREV